MRYLSKSHSLYLGVAREFDKKKSYDKINRKHVHIDKTTNIKEDKREDESDEEEEKKENNTVIRKDKYLNVIYET